MMDAIADFFNSYAILLSKNSNAKAIPNEGCYVRRLGSWRAFKIV